MAALVCILLVVGCAQDSPSPNLATGVVLDEIAATGATTIAFAGGRLIVPEGAAPPGTPVTITPVAAPELPAELAEVVDVATEGVDIDMGGLQPAVPLQLTFDGGLTASGGEPFVLAQRSDTGAFEAVTPAEGPAGALTAAPQHLSKFVAAIFHTSSLFTQYATGSRTAAPDCPAGTVRLGETTVSLSPDASWQSEPSPAHACLTATQGTATVALSPTSAAPWQLSVDRGRFAGHDVTGVNGALMRPMAEAASTNGLVAPGLGARYEFTAKDLPATITARSDPGWHYASAGAIVGLAAADAFGGASPEAQLPGIAECVGGAAAASPPRWDAATTGAAVAAGAQCVALLGGPIPALIAVLTTGPAFLEGVSTHLIREATSLDAAVLIVQAQRPSAAAVSACTDEAVADDLG